MKLLHTSDLLLGQEFAHCYQVADRVRAARMEALRGILALGRKENADAIVVAGNLWADNRVGLPLIEATGALLSKSEIPVYLLPGHRDPITADSPYELYPDRFTGKVKILATNEPLTLKGGVALLPLPVRKRGVSGDPTRALPDREREPLRIGVANTSPEVIVWAPAGWRSESWITFARVARLSVKWKAAFIGAELRKPRTSGKNAKSPGRPGDASRTVG